MKKEHFEGLDVARAILLLGGPIVHAAVMMNPGTLDPSKFDLFYGSINYVSGLFRMQTFFVISGFLAAMYVHRENWLLGRVRSIGIPFLAGWVILVPLTIWLFRDNVWGVVMLRNRVYDNIPTPLHMWFLLTLLFSAVLVSYARNLIGVVSDKLKKLPLWVTAIVFVVMLIVSDLGFRMLVWTGGHGYSPPVTEFGTAIIRSPYFIAFYLLGFVMFRDRRIVTLAMNKTVWLLGAITLGVALVGYNLHTTQHVMVDNIARELFLSITSLLLSVAVFGIAMMIRKSNAVANRLSDASYSVYLFHMPMLALVWMLFEHQVKGPAIFVLLILGSLFLSLALHELMVKPFALQRLIWNGKPMPHK
jgi:glucan biosynthesis protein C